MSAAVFLDRDGTIVDERGYLTPAARLSVYPWSIDAIRLLKRAGFAVVVVTNQGGIARGLLTCDFVEQTHRKLADQFAAGGAVVDAWYYCPHHTSAVVERFSAPCECRKPKIGMMTEAARTLGLDLGQSWVVGDQWGDIRMAHAAGAASILVRTGHGRAQEAARPPEVAAPTTVCDNLIAAAAWILMGG